MDRRQAAGSAVSVGPIPGLDQDKEPGRASSDEADRGVTRPPARAMMASSREGNPMPVGPNRRAFVAGLGSAAAWPVVARAQEKVWRVGYLSPSPAADKASVALFDAFRLQLRDLGYVEGRNLRLDVRRADGDFAKMPVLAAELISLAPDVIIGVTAAGTAAFQHATSSLPIVMLTASDPIESGFVKSLAKPGGNITGLYNQSRDLTAKSLELLHAVIPNANRVALLTSPNPAHQPMVTQAFAGAAVLGMAVVPIMARTPSDLEQAFAIMNKEHCDALVVLADGRITRKIVDLADHWQLPTIYQYAEFVEMGGLLSYGADLTPQFRRAAFYVDRILKGANPADLPVEQPTKLELEVNLKAARALRLTIPESILTRADKVIE
jgi:putative ABC transport system substrate-binding protein